MHALRSFNTAKKLDLVRVAGNQIQFGDEYVFPRDSNTGFKASKPGADEYYTLEDALHIVQNRHLPHAEYLKSASSAGLAAASFVDRKVCMM